MPSARVLTTERKHTIARCVALLLQLKILVDCASHTVNYARFIY